MQSRVAMQMSFLDLCLLLKLVFVLIFLAIYGFNKE